MTSPAPAPGSIPPTPDPTTPSPTPPVVPPVAPIVAPTSARRLLTDTPDEFPENRFRVDSDLPFPEMLARRGLIQNVLGQNVTLDDLGYNALHGYTPAQVDTMERSVEGVSAQDVGRMPGARGNALEGARLIARDAVRTFFETYATEEHQARNTGPIGFFGRRGIRDRAEAMTEQYRARQGGVAATLASLNILSADLYTRALGAENLQRKRPHHFNTAHFERVLSTFTWDGAPPPAGRVVAPRLSHNFLERVQSLRVNSASDQGASVYPMLLQRLVVDPEARNAFIQLHSHNPNSDREHVHHDMETNDKNIEHVEAIASGLREVRKQREEEIHLRNLLERRLIQDRIDKHNEYVELIQEMIKSFQEFRTAQLLRDSIRIGIFTLGTRRDRLQNEKSTAKREMDGASLKIAHAAGKLQPLTAFTNPHSIGAPTTYTPVFTIAGGAPVSPSAFASRLTNDPVPKGSPTNSDFLNAMSALQANIKGLNTPFTNELGGVPGADLRTSTVAVQQKLDECRNTIREAELKMRNAASELVSSNIQFNYDVAAPVAGVPPTPRSSVDFVNFLIEFHTPSVTPPYDFPTPAIPITVRRGANFPLPSDQAILNAFSAIRAQETALKNRKTDLQTQSERIGTEDVKPLPRMSSDQLFYMMMRERLGRDIGIGILCPASNERDQLAALATNMARVQAGTNIQEEININRAQQLLRERIPGLGRRSRGLGRIPRPWDPKETLGVKKFIKKIGILREYKGFLKALDEFPKRPITARDILNLKLDSDFLAKALGELDAIINDKEIDLENRSIMHLLNLRTAMADALQMQDAHIFTQAFRETKNRLPDDIQALKEDEFILRLLQFQQESRQERIQKVDENFKDHRDGKVAYMFRKGYDSLQKRREIRKLEREAKAAGKSPEEQKNIRQNMGFSDVHSLLTVGLALNEIGEAIMHRRRAKKAAKASENAAKAAATATAGEASPQGTADEASEPDSVSHGGSWPANVVRSVGHAGKAVFIDTPWAIGRAWKWVYIDTPRALFGRMTGRRSEKTPKASRRILRRTFAGSVNVADTSLHVTGKILTSPLKIVESAIFSLAKFGSSEKSEIERYNKHSFFGWLMNRDALKKRKAKRSEAARGKPAKVSVSFPKKPAKKGDTHANVPPTH
ncbi:hypothetical protein HYV57_04405 [Candidatus Peregrinibacteria bacterium]|nr:hypothetical protein [Candidatus Peregrinibacteria bacterium]